MEASTQAGASGQVDAKVFVDARGQDCDAEPKKVTISLGCIYDVGVEWNRGANVNRRISP